jgi:hypothetical protein
VGEGGNRSLVNQITAGNKSPWSLTRYLPASDDIEELRRCFNLVWSEFYLVSAAAATITSQISSLSSAQSSASSSLVASVPAWTKTISPPFGIIALNPDGTTTIDARGYGIIQKVL